MIWSYLTTPNFSTTILGGTMLFLLPLNKRPYFWVRLVLGCAVFLVAALFVRLEVMQYNSLASYILQAFLCVMLVWFCCPVSASDALMAAVCGFATQFMATSTAALLCPEAMMPAYGLGMTQFPQATIATVGIHVGMYFLIGLFFAKNMADNGAYHMPTMQPLVSAVLLLIFGMYLDAMTRSYYYSGEVEIYRFGLMYGILCGFLYLCMQLDAQKRVRSAAKAEAEHQLRLKQRQQYELSRKNIELINQKCHRLKMQLTDLRRECGKTLDDALLQELENSVMIYDSVVRTGNEVLDTVLTEKSLRCDQKNITWTCMADGQCLRFMDTVDLYILFGSLLDRAIAQVEKLTTAEKRVVAVTVSAQNGTAFLQFENYCELYAPEPMEKEVQAIAAKYEGTSSCNVQDGICLTRFLFPIPA